MNINQLKDLEKDNDIININNNYGEIIEKITDNENAIYPVYLKEQVTQIITDYDELKKKIVNYMIYKCSQKN